jgi:hypothetical protein
VAPFRTLATYPEPPWLLDVPTSGVASLTEIKSIDSPQKRPHGKHRVLIGIKHSPVAAGGAYLA